MKGNTVSKKRVNDKKKILPTLDPKIANLKRKNAESRKGLAFFKSSSKSSTPLSSIRDTPTPLTFSSMPTFTAANSTSAFF